MKFKGGKYMSQIKEVNIGDNIHTHDDSDISHGLKGVVQIYRKNKETGEVSFWNESHNIIIQEIPEEMKLKEFLFNINKNDDELIDFIDFMKRIIIKRNIKRKKSTRFVGSSDIKSNIDKTDALSQNSFVESVDKTQISESTTNYFKGSKNLMGNALNNTGYNLKEEYKIKSHKSQKFNDTFRELSEERLNNNINEIINFPEYTYFDYLIKKN
jgi:hypothetical protein